MSRTPRIAVVGGGPVGATAAARLMKSGADVTLFEARADGEKPCGGGIPSGALNEFPELSVPSLKRRIVKQVRLYSPSNRLARVTVPDGLHMFRRRLLDSYLRSLVEESGGVCRKTRVRRVRHLRTGGWEVSADDGDHGPFDFLIGADGVQGITRRAVASPFVPQDLTLALYAYVPGVVCADVVLKFYSDFDGYFWIFPRSDHASIGICGRHGMVGKERLEDELFGFVEKYSPDASFPREDLKGFFIPSSMVPVDRVKGGGDWALVGDAAGFTDPITREGIAPAMRSAVKTAARFSASQNLRTLPLSAELARAHGIRKRFFNETFLEGLVRLSEGSPAIRRVLADLFEGKQHYRGLKRRLVLNALPAGWQAGFGALAAAVKTSAARGQW